MDTKIKPLDEMTVAELREELVNKFAFVGAETMTIKSQLISVYNALQKKSIETVAPGVDPGEKHDNAREDQKKYESKAARMKALCDAEPKVRFMIPLGIGEKKGAIEEAQINGYKINILKGVMVNIPMRFAKLLEESYQMTNEAGQEFLMDRNETVKEKLS